MHNQSLEQVARTQAKKPVQGIMVALVTVETWRWEEVMEFLRYLKSRFSETWW